MSDIEDDDDSIIDDISEDSDLIIDPEDEEFTDYETDDEIIDEKEEPQKNDIQIHYYVPPEERITSNILSLFDYVRIVGKRAEQIANGNTVVPITFVNVDDIVESSSIHKEKEMAEKEIREKRCPYMIKKEYQQGNTIFFEVWDINEMIIPY
jgi:DNA-directed RNA polymerase subunit K/omega